MFTTTPDDDELLGRAICSQASWLVVVTGWAQLHLSQTATEELGCGLWCRDRGGLSKATLPGLCCGAPHHEPWAWVPGDWPVRRGADMVAGVHAVSDGRVPVSRASWVPGWEAGGPLRDPGWAPSTGRFLGPMGVTFLLVSGSGADGQGPRNPTSENLQGPRLEVPERAPVN